MLNDTERIAILLRCNYLGLPMVFFFFHVAIAVLSRYPDNASNNKQTENKDCDAHNKILDLHNRFECATAVFSVFFFLFHPCDWNNFGAMRHQLLYCHGTMYGTYFNDSAILNEAA